MQTETTVTIVDQDSVTGAYDMPCKVAIISHPKHGRLYLSQGYGGVDTLEGGAVRWRHGVACQLLAGDTLASLRNNQHNDTTSVLDAMINGHDDARPVLEWTGDMVTNIAKKAGL